MPIGDLLAQISGGEPSSKPSTPLQRSNTLPKRKAEGDLRDGSSKAPRTTTPFETKSSRPTHPAANTPLPQQASNSLSFKGSASVPAKRPSDSRPGVRPAASRPPSAVSRGAPAAPAAPKAPPKKGSFAEIMARAQRAQSLAGQVGKIQHKKVQKVAVPKRTEEERTAARPQERRPGGYTGSAKPSHHRNGVNGHGQKSAPAGFPRPKSTGALPKKMTPARATNEEVEKKTKKAAAATLGYQGTARPKPGSQTKKSNAGRGGALLNQPPPRPKSSRDSRFEEEYDEELDDFIDYDDEEDTHRYYESDGSSDMEAGLDDIDGEERRAEYIARREDVEEERMERERKMAKENRKRRALEELRAAKRR